MRFAAALLCTGLLLAGCNRAPAVSPTEQDAARTAEVAKLKGWDRAFGAPPEAIASANQFGFRAGDYAKAGGGYRSAGGPETIANSFSKKPSQVSFEAAGAAAGKIDRFTFTLAIGGAEDAKIARTRFSKLIKDFLFQFGLKDEGVVQAIADAKPGKGAIAGAQYEIATTPVETGIAPLTVTFTRTGASAPANS